MKEDTIHIFDFDYTLYKTVENIIIWSNRGSGSINGKRCFNITPEEFHSYELGEDEEINEESFQEFHKIDWARAKPIVPVLKIFQCCENKLILTSRNQSIEPFIRIKFDESIPFIGLGNGKTEAKINKINELKREYKNICLYEDSYKLIEYFAKKGDACVYVKYSYDNTSLKFLNFK